MMSARKVFKGKKLPGKSLVRCAMLLSLLLAGAPSLSAQAATNSQSASTEPVDPARIVRLYNRGRYDQALRLSEQRIDQLEAADDGSGLVGALSSHGAILIGLERFDEARVYIQRAINEGTQLMGEDAPSSRIARINYAMSFFSEGDYRSAIPLLKAEYEKQLQRLGTHDYSKLQLYDASVITPMVALAEAYGKSGQTQRALDLMDGKLVAVGNSVPEANARTSFIEALYEIFSAQGRAAELAGVDLDSYIRTTASITGEADNQLYAQRDIQRLVYDAAGETEKAREAAFKNPRYIEDRFEQLLENQEAQAFAFIDEVISQYERECRTYCSDAELFIPILRIKTDYLEFADRNVEAIPDLRLTVRAAAASSRVDDRVLKRAQRELAYALELAGEAGEAMAMDRRASGVVPANDLDGNVELTIARLLRDEGFADEADRIVSEQMACIFPDGETELKYHTPCASGWAAMSEYAGVLEAQGKKEEAAYYRLPFTIQTQWRAKKDEAALQSARELAQRAVQLWEPSDYRTTVALKIYRAQQGRVEIPPYDIPKQWRLCGRWDEPLPPEPETDSNRPELAVMTVRSSRPYQEPERGNLPLGYGHVSAGDLDSAFYQGLTGSMLNFAQYAEQCAFVGKPEDAVRFSQWVLMRAAEMDFPIRDQEDMWLVKAKIEQRLQRFDDAERSLLTVADAYFGGADQPSGVLSDPWKSVEQLIELYGQTGRAERLLALLTRMSESGKFGDNYGTSAASRSLREATYLMFVGMQDFDRAREILAGLSPWQVYYEAEEAGIEGRELAFMKASAMKDHGQRFAILYRAEGNFPAALEALKETKAKTTEFFEAYPPPEDMDPYVGRFLLNGQIHALTGAIYADMGMPAEALSELEKSGLFQMYQMLLQDIQKDSDGEVTTQSFAAMLEGDERGQQFIASFRAGYATAAELAMRAGDEEKAITYFDLAQQFPSKEEWSLYEQQSRWVGVSLGISRAQLRANGLTDAEQLVEGLERQWELASRNSLDSTFLKEMLTMAPTYFGDVLTLRSLARDEGLAKVDDEAAFRHLQWSIMSVTDLSIAQSAAKSILAKADPQIIGLLEERDQISQTLYSRDNVKIGAVTGFGDEPSDPIFGRNLQRLRDIDDELRSIYPDYFEITSSEPVELDRARSSLERDEALLLISPGRFATHMMLVTRSGLEWKTAPFTLDDIESKVLTLRHFLGATTDNELDALETDVMNGLFDREEEVDGGLSGYDRETAKELYQIFIAPFARELEGKEKLIISPGGPLSGLPFAALVSEIAPGRDDDAQSLRDTRYLIDDYAITQIPALRSFILLREQRSNRSVRNIDFMGFGDPTLEGEAIVRGARGTRGTAGANLSPQDVWRGASVDLDTLRKMNRLPGTRQELEALQAAFGASADTVLLADNATETRVKQADLSNVDVLAFATHGVMAGEIRGVAEPGLVFTPPAAATAMDDGYLTASEVALLKLNADWVIISACNTASADGAVGAPALSGLAKSFFHAGARALLVSHWYIRDDVAAELTVRTINAQREQRTLTRAEALQAAMVSVRGETKADDKATWAHPNAWAPLTLISGD